LNFEHLIALNARIGDGDPTSLEDNCVEGGEAGEGRTYLTASIGSLLIDYPNKTSLGQNFKIIYRQKAIKDKQLISFSKKNEYIHERAMNKSNINEPFRLATYTSTIRGKHIPRKPGVYATVSRKSSLDDHVTVAVQADGVHILDVSVNIMYI